MVIKEDVERGFSVNKNCLLVNMQEESLTAKRIICEEVKEATGYPNNIHISSKMMSSCRNASATHTKVLEEKRLKDEQHMQLCVNGKSETR